MATTFDVFGLGVVEKSSPPRILALETDLSSFSFFQRYSVGEGLNFFIKTIVERTNLGTRTTVGDETGQFVGHFYIRADGLSVVVITKPDYPKRTAFSLLNNLSDEFFRKFPDRNRWSTMSPSSTSSYYPELKKHLENAHNPDSTDPFMRVQRELDETKIVLHKTMESLLQRGEKLDDLVQKSEDLSLTSRQFYKTAKKTNQCC